MRGDVRLLLQHHLPAHLADRGRGGGDLAVAPHGDRAHEGPREDEAQHAEDRRLPRGGEDAAVGLRELGVGVLERVEGLAYAGDADDVERRAAEPFAKGDGGGLGEGLFGEGGVAGGFFFFDGVRDGFDHLAGETPEGRVEVFDVAVCKGCM